MLEKLPIYQRNFGQEWKSAAGMMHVGKGRSQKIADFFESIF